MVSRCVIVGAGDFYGFATEYDYENTFFIAADGGYNAFCKMGIAPKLWIGDGDSLEIDTDISIDNHIAADINIACERIALPTHKDDTDMLAAVKQGLLRGCSEFHLYGGMGGRIDHTMANIKTLSYISSLGYQAYMFGDNTYMTVIENSKLYFSEMEQGYISVFSMKDESRGVTISGLEYEIENASLTGTDSVGVSNAFIGKKSSISVLDGRLLIMLEKLPREFPQRA